jgi:isopentenyl-diphosphate delta-isomerase
MVDELLDLVDKDDNVIGTVWKSKSQGNPKLMYRAVAISVFNKKGEVLLQQRSRSKLYDPGVWRMTASGHVAAEENPIKSAQREVFEEIGIGINPVFYKKTLLDVSGKNGIKLPRIFYIYYAFCDDNQKISFNTVEVEATKWVKVSDLEEFSKIANYDLNDFTHKTIKELAKMLKII